MSGKKSKEVFLSCWGRFKYYFKHNLIVAILFYAAIYGPDLVAKFFYGIDIFFEPLFLLGSLGVGVLISYTNRVMSLIFVALIFIMELIQLNYTIFFGSPIDASDLMNIVRESKDVFDLSYLREVGIISALILGLYGVLVYALLRVRRLCIPGIWIILICLAAHKPYHAIRMSHDVWYFQPSITRPSLKNSINTFSYFLFRYCPRGYVQTRIEYAPYQTRSALSDTQNILLIFGESLYADHLQMFGYDRHTFPKTDQMIHTEDGWESRLAISSGISTATSTLLFFNVVREPANLQLLTSNQVNLFKLAKERGFNTYYFSNQESRLTKGLGTKYIDKIITHDTKPLFFALNQDEGLAELLDQIDLDKGKNFVVLHMRSPHSPYEKRYKGRESEFEKFLPTDMMSGRLIYETNTYDNALLYTDQAIMKMVESFRKRAGDRLYSIYITADHGQLFDYNGLWGHNNLVLEQARVPFFCKANKKIDIPPVVSHYQIGLLIAQDLGVLIQNPNEDGTFYLHGNNVDFPYGYIQYRFDGQKVTEVSQGNTNAIQQSKQ